MSGITTTNFIAADGSDIGIELIEKDYLRRIYPSLADQFITPELWVWGDGSRDGTLDETYKSTPVTTFAGGSDWRTVGESGNTNPSTRIRAAIKTDGSLWVWGSNSGTTTFGILGTNDTIDRSTPVTTFAGGNDWKQVSYGTGMMAAIKTDGTLWTWGSQAYGLYSVRGGLGVNDTDTRYTPVTTFAGGENWSQVSVGFKDIAAIKTDGSLWNWGKSTIRTPSTQFGGNFSWRRVHCTSGSAAAILAIKNDGTLWGYGDNDNGVLGIGDTTDRYDSPVTTFAGGTDWKQITSAGDWLSGYNGEIYATKIDGSLWTWGGENSILTPVTTLVGGNDWRIIKDGFAIKTNGTLWKLNPHTPTLFDGSSNWKICSSNMGIKTIEDI